MDYEKFPWPKLDDDLLELGEDWVNHARLNFSRDQSSIYSEGYKMAGNILAKHLEKQRTHIDFLIYPIVFMFRHHIELQLKIIIEEGSYLLDGQRKVRTHHKLHNLWYEVKDILKKVWPDGPDEDLEAAEKIILQLSEIDPHSDAFRYDKDDQGNKHNTELERIDIKQFTEVMNNISGFLYGAGAGISEYVDNRIDLWQEFYP